LTHFNNSCQNFGAIDVLACLGTPRFAALQDTFQNQVVICPRDGSVVISVRKYAKETNMATGTVKWFNGQKGYGFIQPSDGGRDVFVHISAVERAGMTSLNEGQTINYELVTEKGKTSAANLSVA
tara:strand:+ start:609 stop:983 length:375 start_codon:yes stop_codon:yes gene_type:complete